MAKFPEPEFLPLQYVQVVVFGLNYIARVLRCVYTPGGWIYEVQYVIGDEFIVHEFQGDELVEYEELSEEMVG